MAGNDHTAGAFGNDCREGDVIVTLGTALVAYRVAGAAPGPYSPSGCWGPYPGGSYYELAVHSYGCLALDWAAGELLPDGDVPAFVSLAQTASGHGTTHADAACPTTLFYPDRIGTRDAWIGDPDTSQRALAVLEGIGFALRRLIFTNLGIDEGPRRVTVVGGGSRSPYWRQVLADILACPIRVGAGDARTGAAKMTTQDLPGFSLHDNRDDADEIAQPADPETNAVRHYRHLYQQWLGRWS